MSDLHLEFGDEVVKGWLKNVTKKTKYTVLAGDITNWEGRERNLTMLNKKLRPYTNEIIYVLGNHEYYGAEGIPAEKVKSEYRTLTERLGIHLLEDQSISFPDVTFWGATMWSDVDEEAWERMNDHWWFNSREEVLGMHKNSRSALKKFLEEFQEVSSEESSGDGKRGLYVITHHLPSHDLIDPQYREFSTINSGFASDVGDELACSTIDGWIYGHTHAKNCSYLNGVEMMCNPGGYPKERGGNNLGDSFFG